MADTSTRNAGPAAEVDEAARLDQAGRHADAVNCLARAAQTGFAPALGQLGRRLLAGDRAPLLPAQGIDLLGEAARGGEADAAELLAVLAGGGFYRPRDWSFALDCLERAAELGSAPARRQLRILAGAPADHAGPWPALRERVDVAAWTSAPPADALCAAPVIRAVPDLVPPEACAFVIDQARPRLVRAEVQDPETGRPVMGAHRTNRLANFGLTSTSLLNIFIQARISAATGAPAEQLEAFSVLNYRLGEEASEHLDSLDPTVPAYAARIARYGQRSMTCLLYLNDGYDGGATEFPEVGISHRGRAGEALYFVSADASGVPDPVSVHAGRPPTAGEKWVLSQFIRDRSGIRPTAASAR
jgi:hypothetical protein